MGLAVRTESELVGLAYEAAANPELWPQMLGAIAATFHSRGALLPAYTFVPGQLLHSPGGDVLDQFFGERWHERDLRTEAATRRIRSANIVTDQHLFSSEQIETSSYYRGFARAAGVPWFAATVLALEPRGYVALSLQRTEREGPFEKSDLAALEHLLPHLRNAAALARTLNTFRGRALVDGLELGGNPAMLVDHQCQVHAINESALALLGDSLHLRRGRICASGAADHNRLTGAVALACTSAMAETPLIPFVLKSSTGEASLVVRIAPIRQSGSDVFCFHGAMIMLTPLDGSRTTPAELLSTMFGLTRREAQVMALLGEGHPVNAIAETLSISREAIRFHLKSIFAKTDTHRQSEVMAIVARLASLAKWRGNREPS